MKKTISIIFLITITIIFGVVINYNKTSKVDRRKVLYFQSYKNGFEGVSDYTREELSKILGSDYEVRDLSISSMSLIDKNKDEIILNTIKLNTKDFKKYDSIVVSGEKALEFILKYKEDIVKDIPVVFLNVYNSELEQEALKYNLVSGIKTSSVLDGNIDLILNNHKNVKNIHIIGQDKGIYNNTNSYYDKEKYKNKGININSISTKEMLLDDFIKIISKFDKDDAILKANPGDFRDVFFSIDNFQEIFNSVCSKTPVYSISELGIGNGEVGGKIISASMNIKYAVGIVNYIVENDYRENIFIDQTQSTRYVFDKNALKKFNIKQSQLPKNSYILNSFKDLIYANKDLADKVIIIGIYTLIIIFLMICYIVYRLKYEKALKSVLKKSEDLSKLKSHLISNISHELRTPLNVITSSVQLLRHKYKSANELPDNLFDIIDSNSNRLLRLTNNLIDIDKYEYGNLKLTLENVNIVDLIENIIMSTTPLANSKNLHLVFDTNDEEIIMAVDINKIERVILNLISNAIKFSHTKQEININIIRDKDNLKIIVKDRGIGIEEEYIDTIFNRFYQIDNSLTRKNEGSGIGLAIVDSFIKSHNGFISVKSRVNEGTEFIIDLPIIKVNDDVKEYDASKFNTEYNTNLELSDIYI